MWSENYSMLLIFSYCKPLWGIPNQAQAEAALDHTHIFQWQTIAMYTTLVASKALSTASGALIQKQTEIMLIKSGADEIAG